MTTIVLTSPPALVASLPYLVGFAPRESLVLVWLRQGEILLTQRADLPRRLRPEWITALWCHPAAREADAILVVGVSADESADAVVLGVAGHARAVGLAVRDALTTDGGRWRSILCTDPACACWVPQPVPEDILTAVAAEFAFRGVAPVPDRTALEDEVRSHADAEVVRHLARRGIARPTTTRALEAWRDRVLAYLIDGLQDEGPTWTSSTTARLIVGVQDVRVRDVLLWHAAQWDEAALRRALPRLQHATRCAPEDVVAPVATCCAIVAWLTGDGARASVSLQCAQERDPDYSLLQLVSMALASGLPPGTWREATAGLTLAECRHGSGATRP